MDNKYNLRLISKLEAGRMLIASIILFCFQFAIIGYAFYKDAALGRTFLGAFFANALGGRAAGVGICIAFDINLYVSVFYNFFVEIVIVCFSFAIFLFSFNNQYFKFHLFEKLIRTSEKSARKYETVIARYGVAGIFFFVMIPLPVTGPVVGSFIGYFLCLGLLKNFLTVFSGTFVAIVLWAIFFDSLVDHLSKIQGVLLVVLIGLCVYFFKNIREWLSSSK